MASERWAVIADYPDYEVSDHGRVRRCRPDRRGLGCGRVLSPGRQKTGHLFVQLFNSTGVSKCGCKQCVHRLVAAAFLGPCPIGHEVDHIDFNPGNNHWSNLQYLTHAENNLRSFRAGRIVLSHKHGEAANGAKLTTGQVREMRCQYAAGELQRTLAAAFGVNQTTVSAIVRRERWAHVT